MHYFENVVLSGICVLVCAQIAGCSVGKEVRPLSDSEISFLQVRANEILTPVRETSGCDLLVSSLHRGFFADSAQYTVALINEDDDCSSAMSELNTNGKSDGISFVTLQDVEMPADSLESNKPASLDLIHEVHPEDGTGQIAVLQTSMAGSGRLQPFARSQKWSFERPLTSECGRSQRKCPRRSWSAFLRIVVVSCVMLTRRPLRHD